MADMLSASDVLDIDWNRIAQDKIDEGVRREAQRLLREMYSMKAPELHVPVPSEPVEIREKNVVTDPDSWLNQGLNRLAGDAARVILGEGTGNTKADLALGLLGPGAGIATEAAGGNSGVLDWMPGGGALKGMAVVASPKVSRILRSIVRTESDDVADMAKMLAEDAVARLRAYDHFPTRDEINATVAQLGDGLDDLRGSMTIKSIASELTAKTMEDARRALADGKAPTFAIRMPETLNVNSRGLEVDEAGFEARRKQGSQKKEEARRDFYFSLPQEQQRALRDNAIQKSHEAVEEARRAGVTDEEQLRTIRRNAYSNAFGKERDRLYTESKRAENPLVHNSEDTRIKYGSETEKETINAAQRDAFNAALEAARREGINEYDAYRAATVAGARAKREARKAIGGVSRESELAGKKAEKRNIRIAHDMFDQDIKDEIYRTVEQARSDARTRFIASGLTEKEAIRKANDVAQTERAKLTRKMVKELGFKSVNDPRIAQYSQLSRNGNHTLKPSSIIVSEAAEPERVYSPGFPDMSMLDDVPDSEIEALLREYGETPTADRIFNREYLEELLKEEGY